MNECKWQPHKMFLQWKGNIQRDLNIKTKYWDLTKFNIFTFSFMCPQFMTFTDFLLYRIRTQKLFRLQVHNLFIYIIYIYAYF